MNKHTPGLVSYLPSFSGDGYNYGGGIVVSFGDVSIQLGGLSPTSGYDEKVVSLARLIAAAPELLGALRTARAWIGSASELATLDPYLIYAEIDAAIAKAEGRS